MAQMLWFNENRSCIEIMSVTLPRHHHLSFNENRSCIEIILGEFIKTLLFCLMKTEVVLKYDYRCWIAYFNIV